MSNLQQTIEEIWKPFKEIKGYEINNFGRLKTPKGFIIKGGKSYIRTSVNHTKYHFCKSELISHYFKRQYKSESTSLKNEKWRDVVGFEGLYSVSNFGRVRTVEKIVIKSNNVRHFVKEKILAPRRRSNGMKYLCYRLFKNRIGVSYSTHRLVAQAFIPNPNNFEVVNHIDGNTTNNKVKNLQWCSVVYNRHHAEWDLGVFNKHKKSVSIYDMSGKHLATTATVSEAAELINGHRSAITKVIKGEYLQHKGYKFKYAS